MIINQYIYIYLILYKMYSFRNSYWNFTLKASDSFLQITFLWHEFNSGFFITVIFCVKVLISWIPICLEQNSCNMYGADACSTNLQYKLDSSFDFFSMISKSSNAVQWIMTITQQPHTVTCSVCVWFCLLNASLWMNRHVTSGCMCLCVHSMGSDYWSRISVSCSVFHKCICVSLSPWCHCRR